MQVIFLKSMALLISSILKIIIIIIILIIIIIIFKNICNAITMFIDLKSCFKQQWEG